jgi:hypothetical protein
VQRTARHLVSLVVELGPHSKTVGEA